MKYTPKEQKLINNLQHQIDLIITQYKNINIKAEKFKTKINKNMSILNARETVLRVKIRSINNKIQKRCKHKGDTSLRYNPRDDISYTHRVICNDCGEQIGTRGEQTPYG